MILGFADMLGMPTDIGEEFEELRWHFSKNFELSIEIFLSRMVVLSEAGEM